MPSMLDGLPNAARPKVYTSRIPLVYIRKTPLPNLISSQATNVNQRRKPSFVLLGNMSIERRT